MTLTLFTDYSLRILMFAALREGRRFSVDDVAGAYGLSRNHTAKAVNFLTQQGYLTARRGRGGGICLGRPAGDIRLGSVIRETETDAPIVECFAPATNTCPLIHACVLKRALAEAWQGFYAGLDRYTLADLVRRPQTLNRALALTA